MSAATAGALFLVAVAAHAQDLEIDPLAVDINGGLIVALAFEDLASVTLRAIVDLQMPDDDALILEIAARRLHEAAAAMRDGKKVSHLAFDAMEDTGNRISRLVHTNPTERGIYLLHRLLASTKTLVDVMRLTKDLLEAAP